MSPLPAPTEPPRGGLLGHALTAFADPALSPPERRAAIAAALAPLLAAAGLAGDASGMAQAYAALHALAHTPRGPEAAPLDDATALEWLRTNASGFSQSFKAIGEALLALHAGESEAGAGRDSHWPVLRIDSFNPDFEAAGTPPRLLLRPQPVWGVLRIDGLTMLTNIPPVAWEHQTGTEPLLAWELANWRAEAPLGVAKDARIARLRWLIGMSVATMAILRRDGLPV